VEVIWLGRQRTEHRSAHTHSHRSEPLVIGIIEFAPRQGPDLDGHQRQPMAQETKQLIVAPVQTGLDQAAQILGH